LKTQTQKISHEKNTQLEWFVLNGGSSTDFFLKKQNPIFNTNPLQQVFFIAWWIISEENRHLHQEKLAEQRSPSKKVSTSFITNKTKLEKKTKDDQETKQ